MADNNWLDIKGYANSWSFKTENSEGLLQRIIETLSSEGDVVFDFFVGSGTTAATAAKMGRPWVAVEMGRHYETVTRPRLEQVLFGDQSGISKEIGWKGGGAFKYIALESYEDCLENLRLTKDVDVTGSGSNFAREFRLRYSLDVETRGSQSLLNIDGFSDPTSYKLQVRRPGTDEYVTKRVDLVETFSYIIGLRVEHIAGPQTFGASFKRIEDPDLPDDQDTKLVVDGRIQQDKDGPWWFRKVEGWVPANPADPNNGQREKVLIVWRKLTDDLEKDNLMLDEWFKANRISTRDFEFDTIYVNGSNNLPNLRQEGDIWKVRLIEEDFHRLMWDIEDV